MKKLMTYLIDIIITSPPYNIGINYGTYYNDNKTKAEYLEWLEQIARESLSVLKENGSFFLNVGHTSKTPLLPFEIATKFEQVGYKLQNTIMWVKSISIDNEDIGKSNCSISEDISVGHFNPINSRLYLNNCFEYIYHFTKSRNVKINKLADGLAVPYQDKSNIGRYSNKDKRDRGNIWFIPYKTIQIKRKHPSAFPIKLPMNCIKLHGYNKNTIVYDPFIGSGTTALASIELCVNYLGTEISNEYVKLAKERINMKFR
ncbi:MAG: DNA-methyltransferase [Nitrososphaeraceae archaeon]